MKLPMMKEYLNVYRGGKYLFLLIAAVLVGSLVVKRYSPPNFADLIVEDLNLSKIQIKRKNGNSPVYMFESKKGQKYYLDYLTLSDKTLRLLEASDKATVWYSLSLLNKRSIFQVYTENKKLAYEDLSKRFVKRVRRSIYFSVVGLVVCLVFYFYCSVMSSRISRLTDYDR